MFNIKNDSSILICPVCSQTLLQYEKYLACRNQHTFDLSRSGYVNLLLPQYKKSLNPGDNKEMVKSRYYFLSKDYYLPITNAINAELEKISHPCQLTDVGCGTGYYLAQIQDHFAHINEGNTYWGLDVSKDAIQCAAQRCKNVNWMVSNATRLPFQAQSIDVMLSVFSPLGVEEARRVLMPHGKIFVVTPTSLHLLELKKILFKDIYQKDAEHIGHIADQFELKERIPIHFPLHLKTKEDIENLLKMTPFFWRSSKEKQEELLQYNELNVSADVILWVFSTI